MYAINPPQEKVRERERERERDMTEPQAPAEAVVHGQGETGTNKCCARGVGTQKSAPGFGWDRGHVRVTQEPTFQLNLHRVEVSAGLRSQNGWIF